VSKDFHEKLTNLSTAWAEADRDANTLEADAKQHYAKVFLINKADMGVEEAKQAVEASPGYREAQQKAIEARYRANLAKRGIRDAETSFERWRSLQATERFITRAAT